MTSKGKDGKSSTKSNGACRRPHLIKEKDYRELEDLFRHHIESFDYMVEHGLETMLLNIKPIEVTDSSSDQKLRNILFIFLKDLSFQERQFTITFCLLSWT